jgi:hypothetical protein
LLESEAKEIVRVFTNPGVTFFTFMIYRLKILC